jgi:hypothetical protein
MASFPFTFPHAGRTFSVVTDGGVGGRGEGGATATQEIFVRIIGIRGLHEFGPAAPGESNSRLRDRICRWYDATYAVAADARGAELDGA